MAGIWNDKSPHKNKAQIYRGKRDERKNAMITTKEELKHYLRQDATALRCGNRKRPRLMGDELWKFQIILRKNEYYSHLFSRNKLCLPRYVWYRLRFKKYSLKLGLTIPLNVFGPGLAIAHYGTIVVSKAARVGKNCRIHEGVNIGATNGSGNAPRIGDNVFIGAGAKILGDITVADDVAIGANAVVVRSIEEKGVTYGGIPAKKISSNSSHANLPRELFQ